MTIEQLFDWVDTSFACGSLSLECGPRTRTFHFDSGYVTHASSADPTEHLGQMLLGRGLVPEDALTDAFRVQADTGVRLGKILLMIDAVSEQSLRELIELKIREAICDALTWAEGTFVFEPDPSTAVSEYEVSVNLRGAIQEGQGRVELWREIRSVIPSDDAVLWVCGPQHRGEIPEDSPEFALLQLVDNGLCIEQIVLQSRLLRFEVNRRLAALVQLGLLAVDKRRRRRPAGEQELSTEELQQAARGRADGGDRAGALELVNRALERDPDSQEVKALHTSLERSLFAELSRELLTSFRVPTLLKSKEELSDIELDEAERYLTGRIDGRWDLLSLMRISPLREVEALITFKRLARRGIISL